MLERRKQNYHPSKPAKCCTAPLIKHWEGRGRHISEFQGNLMYIVSSGTAQGYTEKYCLKTSKPSLCMRSSSTILKFGFKVEVQGRGGCGRRREGGIRLVSHEAAAAPVLRTGGVEMGLRLVSHSNRC